MNTERLLSPDNVNASQGWALLDWCCHVGGNEFTIQFIGVAGSADQRHGNALASLEPFYKAEGMRERLSWTAGDSRRQKVRLWTLCPESLAILRPFFSEGIFSYIQRSTQWLEDLTIYRRGEMLLGVITHESTAYFRLTESEWLQFDKLEICTRDPLA